MRHFPTYHRMSSVKDLIARLDAAKLQAEVGAGVGGAALHMQCPRWPWRGLPALLGLPRHQCHARSFLPSSTISSVFPIPQAEEAERQRLAEEEAQRLAEERIRVEKLEKEAAERARQVGRAGHTRDTDRRPNQNEHSADSGLWGGCRRAANGRRGQQAPQWC